MPIFFQHIIDADTRLGIWKIEEPESFFLSNVPLQQEVHHPHKRLQHLAGRFLLRFLFPGFPYELIRIADTRKPFLENEEYHFSISHCGDYAAAIVSKTKRVGVDIEIPSEKVIRIMNKFLSEAEMGEWSMVNGEWSMPAFPQRSEGSVKAFRSDSRLPPSPPAGGFGGQGPTSDSRLSTPDSRLPTLLWSVKEAVFKWYGLGEVDFKKNIHLGKHQVEVQHIECFFSKTNQKLTVHYHQFDHLVLAWLIT